MSNRRTISINIGGGSFLTALFIVFLALKMTGNIDWSWWWVTAPLWWPFAAFGGVLLAMLTVGLVVLIVMGLVALVIAFAERR